MNTSHAKPVLAADANDEWLEVVREQIASLKFGTVQITVHDTCVVQVERLEKFRIEKRREEFSKPTGRPEAKNEITSDGRPENWKPTNSERQPNDG